MMALDWTRSQLKKVTYFLCSLHILIITASNYLVQIPFSVIGIKATWGALTFPFIFLTTDLTVRIYGAGLAKRIIFICLFPAMLISYIVSILFAQGKWQGLIVFLHCDFEVARIAIASFLAYVSGQLMDILVFNRFRKFSYWWVAPSVSAVFGNALDTIIFFFISFYHSTNVFMALNWIEIAWVDYGFKLFISGLFFLPLYGIIINYLIIKLINKLD